MATWGHMITLAGPLGVTCGQVSRDSGCLLLRALGLLLWAASLAKALEFMGISRLRLHPAATMTILGKCPHCL